MAKGSGNTGMVVGLVFTILLAMTFLGVSYKLNEDLTKMKSQVTAAEEKWERENQQVKELTQERNNVRKLLTGRENEAVQYDHYKSTWLDSADAKLNELLSQEWVTNADWQDIQNTNLKEAWEGLRQAQLSRQSREYVPHYHELFQELYDQVTAVIHIIPHLRVQRLRAREEVEAVRRQLREEKERLQSEITRLGDELRRVQDEKINEAQRFDIERRRLNEESETLREESTRLQREYRLESARRESTISQLENRINDLTKKEQRNFLENSSPDGEVVYSDPSLGYAWIDIGRRDGLRRNTRFQVYQFVKGGRQKIKGVIEVRRVEEDMAQCAIIEGEIVEHPITGDLIETPDPNDPIVKGDLVRTPVFDAEEQKVFVFLGEEPQNPYYTQTEMIEKIEEFGGRVDNEVSIETDFVILLGQTDESAEYQEQIRLASQFGVIFMVERELLEYLGSR